MLVIKAGIHNIANREDPDQTASSKEAVLLLKKQSDRCLCCLSRSVWQQ